MKKLPLLFSLGLLIFCASPRAEALHMIADLPISEHGLCLGLGKKGGGAEPLTRERIAAVIKRLREMKVDGKRLLDPLKFNLVSSGRSNQFGGNRITLSMLVLDQFGNHLSAPVATGTVAHEIGHWIGHNMDIRGKTAYEAFRSSAFRACHGFVRYSSHFRDGRAHNNDLNETFAEVFSGYVTAPNYLKTACPAGYDFMRDQVFRGETSRCPDPNKKPTKPNKILLPKPRPKEAPPRVPVESAETPVVRAADGEHPIPLPKARPKNLGETSQSAAEGE